MSTGRYLQRCPEAVQLHHQRTVLRLEPSTPRELRWPLGAVLVLRGCFSLGKSAYAADGDHSATAGPDWHRK